MSYFRTSSRAQDEENSQGRQQNHTRLKGDQLGLQICEFSDVGSGLDSEALPGFMAMREFVKDPQNRISNLFIDDLSRLTRDSVLPLQLLQELRKEGVAVYSYEEGLVNSRQMEMLVRVKSWQNNELSRSTSVLTKGGLRAAVRRNLNPASTAAFGYEREAVKYGKEVHYKWVPAEGAAQIVKRIFDSYDQGFRIMEIVEELNREKVPAPRVALWQTSTVRRILKNKAYAGYIIIGKNPSTRFDDGDDYLEDEDREDDTYIESPNGHEPLVTEELYDRVQRRMAANNRTGPDEATEPGLSSPRSTASPNPLSERLKCGLCGSNMVVANQSTGKKLMCSRKKNSGVAQCNKRDVPLFQTLELITDELCQQVITEEAIAEQIEILREIAPDVLWQEEKRRKDIYARLSQVQGEKKNLMDLAKLYGTQDFTLSDTLMNELRDLLGEEERLNSESFNISEETKEQEAFLTNPEEVAKIARELGTYLYSEDQAATREFLRLFIQRVDLFEGHGKIQYSLPLPDPCSKQGKHESHVGPLDHNILLQHASPLSLAPSSPKQSAGVSLVFQDDVDAVLGPGPAGGVGNALAVQGAGDVQNTPARLGQVEDALDHGSGVRVRFQRGRLLGPVLDVDLAEAIGDPAGDPESTGGGLPHPPQDLGGKIFRVKFVHGLDDGLHQLAGGGVVGVLGDGHHSNALASRHGLESDGVFALAGEPRKLPYENLPKGSLRFGSLVKHLPELGTVGDSAALGLVHVLASHNVAVLVGVVPERPQLGGDG